MGSSSTSTVYIHVIEDVIAKVREEFITNGGPGEGVLTELQGLWELKMMQAGAVLGPTDRSSAAELPALGAPANTLRDLNEPYEGPEEYETPTADLLFPPTPLETPIETPLPAQTPLSLTGTVGPVDETEASGRQSGRPSQYMQPPSWLNQRPRLDVSVVYDEGHEEGNRGTTHQPMTQDFLRLTSGKRKREEIPSQYRPGGYIPQQDGSGDVTADEYDDDDEEEPLNENDDDDDDDLDDGDDDDDDKEVDTQDLILAQFDKVTRAKNRWKCTLKGGIMNINNRDILFNKASGEFDF